MTQEGIIFDFNGTMFWDAHIHEKAWNIIAIKRTGHKLSVNELAHKMHGRTNAAIIEFMLGRQASSAEIKEIAGEKELMYRNICLEQKGIMQFADGLIPLLNELKVSKVPMTIATSSDKENVDFFIEHFHLHQWFDLDKIVFNEGLFPGKPAPDMYLKALKNINVCPENAIVFEDAPSGILSAQRAGIKKIIQVISNPIIEKDTQNNLFQVISSFKEIDPDTLLS